MFSEQDNFSEHVQSIKKQVKIAFVVVFSCDGKLVFGSRFDSFKYQQSKSILMFDVGKVSTQIRQRQQILVQSCSFKWLLTAGS